MPARSTPSTTTANWLTNDEQRAWRAVLRMQTVLSSRLDRDLVEQSNISDSDYSVLVALSEAPEGRMRSFELGRETQWEKSRLSHHLSRMEKRGLIAREDCPTDARGAYVVLTATGRSTIRDAAPLHVGSVRKYFVDILSPAQLDALSSAATAVIAAVEASER